MPQKQPALQQGVVGVQELPVQLLAPGQGAGRGVGRGPEEVMQAQAADPIHLAGQEHGLLAPTVSSLLLVCQCRYTFPIYKLA